MLIWMNSPLEFTVLGQPPIAGMLSVFTMRVSRKLNMPLILYQLTAKCTEGKRRKVWTPTFRNKLSDNYLKRQSWNNVKKQRDVHNIALSLSLCKEVFHEIREKFSEIEPKAMRRCSDMNSRDLKKREEKRNVHLIVYDGSDEKIFFKKMAISMWEQFSFVNSDSFKKYRNLFITWIYVLFVKSISFDELNKSCNRRLIRQVLMIVT